MSKKSLSESDICDRFITQSPLPNSESQGSVLCAVWFTFQINLTEVLKDPATLLKE